MLVLKDSEKIDKSVFDGLNSMMKRRIEGSISCAIDEECNDFIKEFDSKIYIPGNVRIDEKIPRVMHPYFIIRSLNRFFGVESMIRYNDFSHSDTEILRDIYLVSPKVYIPQIYNISVSEVIGACKQMIANYFDLRIKRIGDVDPRPPKIIFNGIDLDDPCVILVDSAEVL